MSDKLNVWYSEGLKFSCTGCGRCCTGSPGYTWVSEEEIVAMAKYLNMPIDEFGKKYLRRIGQRYSLLERPKTFDCIFLQGKQCTVYPVRPTQCQTFPFWPSILANPQAWRDAAIGCEGIRDDADVVTLEEIEQQRLRQAESEKK